MEENQKHKRERKNEQVIAGNLYVTSARAAEFLGVSKSCVLFYARNGLKHLEMGGYKYFREDWLQEFVNGRISS
jgi:hypothetical protein